MNEMTLKDAVEEKEYIVRQIDTDDEELKTFLFSLGCYEGGTHYSGFSFEGQLCRFHQGRPV